MGSLLGIYISGGGVPKDSVDTVHVKFEGIVGDNQHDKKHHGGPLRAVCVLENELLEKLILEGHPIGPGTTGENLLVAGFQLEIGSLFTIDEVELEVVSAATPCKTISESFTEGQFNRISHKKNPGETRWYCKVLKEGWIRISS
jgi:MOSC domain-containing protein YiiM